jgi:SOS-response transcriptional repressor LexA
MKAEIDKILEEYRRRNFNIQSEFGKGCGMQKTSKKYKEAIDQATSSLTSLIIKWLKERKKKRYFVVLAQDGGHWIELDYSDIEFNQLITELIGEVR